MGHVSRIAGYLYVVTALSAAVTVEGAGGLNVMVNPNGSYDLSVPSTGWRIGGDIGFPLSEVDVAKGSDALDDYTEIVFAYAADTPRRGAIRVYARRPMVMFSSTLPAGGANTNPFPVLSRYPRGLHHIHFAGMFAFPTFYGYSADSPWAFFDTSANTWILSPVKNFMTSSTTFGPREEIVSGIAPGIGTLPEGFNHRVLLVVGEGINRTFEAWGRALTDLTGKTRPANDADASLAYLGYWTDTGAAYYYRTEPSMTYPETLAAIKQEFDRNGIALGYMQLDSWFYPKGARSDWGDRSGGIYNYSAATALFGESLKAFQRKVGIPLIAHARWIDAHSPYRQQYRISGNVSIDPAYWDAAARYLFNSGVATYEQDWLFDHAFTDFNLTDPEMFLDQMSASMAKQNLTMQYCMATPRHLMQGTKYANLTTARVSGDRFDRNVWNIFLYASRFVSALGIYPFTDVFMSAETDNLLLAVLSAGPVGIGDALGKMDTANLLRAVRRDGAIVKPDVPVTPTDATFLNDSDSLKMPVVASTYSDFGGARTHYVFAYSQGVDMVANFRLSDLGVNGPAYVYDYFAGAGRLAAEGDSVWQPMPEGRAYFVVAPIGASGIAMLGDQGHFVSMGRKRIAEMMDDGVVRMSVLFAAGESERTIHGYAPQAPVVRALTGAAGVVRYDSHSQRFAFSVAPGAEGKAAVEVELPRRNALPAVR